VEFVVDKEALGQVSLRVIRFFSCRHHSTSAHARLLQYVAVSRRIKGLSVETSRMQRCLGNWDIGGKSISLSFRLEIFKLHLVYERDF